MIGYCQSQQAAESSEALLHTQPAAAGRGERAGGEAGTQPLQVPEKVCPRAIGVFEWINLADKVSHITPLKMLLPCSI